MWYYTPEEYFGNVSVKSLGFKDLHSINDLAKMLNTNGVKLLEVINEPNYFEYQIPKKRGGKRNIQAPGKYLKNIQQKLNEHFQLLYAEQKMKPVHGFVPKYSSSAKSIVSNAKAHVGKKVVLNIDLLNFFESISAKQVKQMFLQPPFVLPEKIATVLTLLVTYKNKLPTGAPTSPVVSNFICMALDIALQEKCKEMKWRYTRYADDLTFSSNSPLGVKNIYGVIEIIRNYGFEVNAKKFRIQSDKSKQIVTGIKVNEKPNLERSYIRNIRAALYQWNKHGLDIASIKEHNLSANKSETKSNLHQMNQYFINRLGGRIAFLAMVRGKDDALYIKYRDKFLALTAEITEK